jgi:hypothetical protein
VVANNLIDSFKKDRPTIPTKAHHAPHAPMPRAEPLPEPEPPAAAPVAIRDKRVLEEMERKVKQDNKAQFAEHKAYLRRAMFTIVSQVRGIQHWSPREDAILDANVAWLIELYYQEGASHDIVSESTRSVQANRTMDEDARAAEGLAPMAPKP